MRTVAPKLGDEEEEKLAKDMRDLYDKLLPTEQVEENRKRLVEKLEKIFNDEWPGHDIKVHLFGSSGNLLCSDSSDGTHPLPDVTRLATNQFQWTFASRHLGVNSKACA